MAVSRRRFIGGAAGIGAGATTALAAPQPSLAHTPQATPATTPPVEVIALNRMAYGPRPGDIDRVRNMGVNAYIEEQLGAPATDTDANEEGYKRVLAARLKLKYDAGEGYAARNEVLPLDMLSKSVKDLWDRSHFQIKMDHQERMRPWNEVHVATWLRAIYSTWQLREIMVEFWHDHFNVSASSDAAISAGFPDYDRLMRANWNGNFRKLTESVARSTAMMYYLDNRSNKDGGGEGSNENYARELFELHTLGSDNYLKFYDDRTGVGTVTYNNETFARGYIDDDVYEAARCFSGWSVADGTKEYNRQARPDTGEFFYDENWHDSNQKIVLGQQIRRSQTALKDGQDVLNLLCYHIGTARHLCLKLCRRLIADKPPQRVVDAAVAAWMANRQSDDQIKQVLHVILTSNEFKTTWGHKVKRPFESLVSYLRAVNAEMPVDVLDVSGNANEGNYWQRVQWSYNGAGQRRFEWPTPTGHPDRASYWTTTNGLLRRWNLPYVLTQPWSAKIGVDLVGQTRMTDTCTQIVDFWIARLCGYEISAITRQALLDFFSQSANGGNPNQPPRPVNEEYGEVADVLRDRLNTMVHLLAMSPDFQLR